MSVLSRFIFRGNLYELLVLTSGTVSYIRLSIEYGFHCTAVTRLNCYRNRLILHKIFTCMTYYHFNEGPEIIASQRTMPDCLGS